VKHKSGTAGETTNTLNGSLPLPTVRSNSLIVESSKLSKQWDVSVRHYHEEQRTVHMGDRVHGGPTCIHNPGAAHVRPGNRLAGRGEEMRTHCKVTEQDTEQNKMMTTYLKRLSQIP
jgi:hypothetical protein